MLSSFLLIGSLTAGLADPDSAADAVTLRDGQVVLGQWVEPAPKGKAVLIVRRAWAADHLPERLRSWEAADASAIKRAKAERLARLEAWRRERGAEPGDAIAPWIESEIGRLKASDALPPLMVVTLNRGDVRRLVRRPPGTARKLRQAWRAGFADPEARPIAELTSALEGRGFAMTGIDPAPIDDLLPLPVESEARWKARRAATEVLQERSLRFIRYQGLLLPEGTPGQPIDAGGAVGGLVKSLLGDGPGEDPLVAKGRDVASRGRMGMLVTTLDTAGDLSGVKVEIVLYARLKGERWERAASRTASVRSVDVRPGDGENLAADPQVQAALRTIEGLGLAVPDDLRRTSLNIGAATQKALGLARTEIQPDLDALKLPVGEPTRAD